MPVNETGYARRTRDAVLTEIQNYLRGKISLKLELDNEAVLGNTSNLDADSIDQLEQLIEECYNAYDVDNASDDRFVALSLLSGVKRGGETYGLVSATLDLDAAQSYAPFALIAHVIDEPLNRWLNRDAVVSTGAGSYPAVFQSEFKGSAAIAPAGTLVVIAPTVTGWNSITNAATATPGTDIESIAALRIRREVALSSGGSRTRGSIQAKLALLPGVLSVKVFENTTSATDANGIGPHGLRPVVWDGSPAAADNDAIAQVIYDHGAEGILSQGSQSGIAQDPTNGPSTIYFDRAATFAVTVAVEIQSAQGVATDDVRAAIIAKMPVLVGQEVTFNRLSSAVFKVTGVDDWVTFTINGGSADLPAVQSRIYLLDPGDITVTGDVT
ncbi:MAG TPA: baseplate J/gp47 family protein [Polyangiaceae bacterium]|nr:baseplate J/gp47 family protein [Polyangiaceae bacterium]